MSAPATNLSTRREYAALLRRFMAGRLTTDEYEDAYFELEERGRDDACWGVFAAAWHCYDDIIPHRMTGDHKPTPELRKLVARWILFLRSGAEYRPARLSRNSERASRVRAGQVGGWLLGIGLLCFAVSGLTGWMPGMAIALCIVIPGYALAQRGGVSLDPAVAVCAFEPESCWPFASADDFRRARATPTYLYGGWATHVGGPGR